MESSEIISQQFNQDETTQWWSKLPFKLQNVKITKGIRPIGFRFSKYIFNIEATINENNIVACGEDQVSESAMTKAIGEFIERATLMSCSKSPNYSETSNGWAAHESISSCKQAAILELIERDAVLTHWYKSTPFLRLDLATLPQSISHWMATELAQSEFPILEILISTEGLGPSITCLFMNEKGFGVSGHATKTTLLESIESAISETCRAAHLTIRKSFWEDSQSLQSYNKRKIDPGAHAVYYAYHEPFPNWLYGDLVSWKLAEKNWLQRIKTISDNSFNFEVFLQKPCVVGRASHPMLLDLNWGIPNLTEIQKKMKLRKSINEFDLEKINLKPHIIS